MKKLKKTINLVEQTMMIFFITLGAIFTGGMVYGLVMSIWNALSH